MLTGNKHHDRLECLRLARYERNYAANYSLSPASVDAAIARAERYEAMAAGFGG